MNELSTGWKIFRIICIIQLILVAFQMVVSIAGLFYRHNFLFQAIRVGAYVFIFWFLYLGLTLLNDNYPDTPLSPAQKRKFNWLFLVNFLLIAFLFAQLVSSWQILMPYVDNSGMGMLAYIKMDPFLVVYTLVLTLHFIFLSGMFKLRKTIHRNTVNTWQQQFEERSPENQH